MIKTSLINMPPDGEQLYEIFKDEKMSCFLDSGLFNKDIGRYSFIGSNPFLIFKSKGTRIEIEKDGRIDILEGNPLNILQGLLDKYKTYSSEELAPFTGGAAVGFFSYDLGRQIEVLPDTNIDDLKVPDIYLGFYDKGVAIDHLLDRAYVFATGLPFSGIARLEKAERDLRQILEKLKKKSTRVNVRREGLIANSNLEKHFTKLEYCEVVKKALEYIYSGDIYQVNISQRFSVKYDKSSWELYKKLRRINPAPFAAFLNFDDIAVLSSSPERFLRISGSSIETRPIKGTRPRGINQKEDMRLKNELLKSEKDKAELVMIVDLERNDLGRLCKYGTVKVRELFRLEQYASVFHLVSTITGELKEKNNFSKIIRATFPGGSITGAPKIRSMEIIEELEPVKRGIYTGAIGYTGFNGESDLSIAIRTVIIKDKRAYFQAGGGIVADSDPLEEYEETLHKAKALKDSLGL